MIKNAIEKKSKVLYNNFLWKKNKMIEMLIIVAKIAALEMVVNKAKLNKISMSINTNFKFSFKWIVQKSKNQRDTNSKKNG